MLNSLVDLSSKLTCPEREVSSAERSQELMSQINTGKTVYVENTSLKKYVLRSFLKDKYIGVITSTIKIII